MSQASTIFVRNLLLLGYVPPKARLARAARERKAKAARQGAVKKDGAATAGAYAVSRAVDLAVGEATGIRSVDERPAMGFAPSAPFGDAMFAQSNEIGLFDILHYFLTTCLEQSVSDEYARELE